MNTTSFHSKAELQNSWAIPGALFSFLASGKETNGEFALLKIEVLKGNEPPGHTHTRESESYIILVYPFYNRRNGSDYKYW